jgi:hypothetical protein
LLLAAVSVGLLAVIFHVTALEPATIALGGLFVWAVVVVFIVGDKYRQWQRRRRIR